VGELFNAFRPDDIEEEAGRTNMRPQEVINGVPEDLRSGLVQPFRRVLYVALATPSFGTAEMLKLVVFTDFIMKAAVCKDKAGLEYLSYRGKLDFEAGGMRCAEMAPTGCRVSGTASYRFSHGQEQEEWMLTFESGSERDTFLTNLQQAIASAE
jgi:hypothetical protein